MNEEKKNNEEDEAGAEDLLKEAIEAMEGDGLKDEAAIIEDAAKMADHLGAFVVSWLPDENPSTRRKWLAEECLKIRLALIG